VNPSPESVPATTGRHPMRVARRGVPAPGGKAASCRRAGQNPGKGGSRACRHGSGSAPTPPERPKLGSGEAVEVGRVGVQGSRRRPTLPGRKVDAFRSAAPVCPFWTWSGNSRVLHPTLRDDRSDRARRIFMALGRDVPVDRRKKIATRRRGRGASSRCSSFCSAGASSSRSGSGEGDFEIAGGLILFILASRIWCSPSQTSQPSGGLRHCSARHAADRRPRPSRRFSSSPSPSAS